MKLRLGSLLARTGVVVVVLLLFVCVFSSCQQRTTAAQGAPSGGVTPCIAQPVATEESHASGDGEDYIGSSPYYPKSGESYPHYQERIDRLMKLQEEDLTALQLAAKEISEDLAVLEDKLSLMLAQQVDLRLGLAAGHAANGLGMMSQHPVESYKVKKGDTLQSIAYKRYGCYQGWLALYQVNQENLLSGPDYIQEGSRLFLPRFHTERLPLCGLKA